MRDIRYQRYSSSASLSTGNRLVRIVRKKHIPRSLNVAGYAIKTWYAGQPTECDICREAHVAKNCPFRGKCRKCMQEGHVARDCTNPPNVWGTTTANAASDASLDVSRMDASAAEEVSASSAPFDSWGSQVDLHDSDVSDSHAASDEAVLLIILNQLRLLLLVLRLRWSRLRRFANEAVLLVNLMVKVLVLHHPSKRGRKKVSGSPEGPGCYPRRFLAGKLVPHLPQLNPALLVLDNYEACFHFDYDGP